MADPDPTQHIGETCSWYDLPCHLTAFAEWLKGIILWLPQFVVEKLTDLAIIAIEAIALPPDMLNAVGNAFAAAGPGMTYFAGMFAVKEGLAMVFTAFGIRFLLRALPFSF